MESQALNVIKQFAHKYQFQDALDKINDISEDIDIKELKAEIEDILLDIHKTIIGKVIFSDKEEEAAAQEDALNATDLLDTALNEIKNCENIEVGAIDEVETFLKAEEELIKKYTDIKPVRVIGTKAGKTNKKFNDFYDKNEKLIIGGVVVVVAAGIISLAILSHNYKKNQSQEEKNNKPETTQQDGINKPGTTQPNKTIATPNNSSSTDVKVVTEQDIKNAATTVYNSWSKITDEYTLDDVENVIRVFNGLDSKLTLDEADDIVQSIMEIVTVPRVNNILVGTPYEIKTVNVADILINKDEKVIKMQELLNAALSSNDLQSIATSTLQEEVMAYKYSSLNGLDAKSRLIWARLAEYINAINGTLGEDFYIEYNGNLYSHKEVLNSDILENIAITAKNEISGKTI